MSENRQQYQERVESEFNRLAEQLGRFMARVENRARKEYQFVGRELDEKSQTVRERLSALKASSSEAWKDLRPGFEGAWGDLRQAFAKARQRFSEEKASPPG